jgi:hypothetical protein
MALVRIKNDRTSNCVVITSSAPLLINICLVLRKQYGSLLGTSSGGVFEVAIVKDNMHILKEDAGNQLVLVKVMAKKVDPSY